MKKFTLLDGTILIVWLLPAIYLFFIYQSLPAIVPTHYNINGDINGYSSKSRFLLWMVFIQLITLLVYLLLKFLPAIDPKKQVKNGEATFQKLGFGIVFFLSALNIAIMFSAIHHGFKIDKLIFPITGLLFAFIGNLMHSIKPNYFAGIRTPWTLESEDTWRATHRLAGKLWFAGGILITITMLILPPQSGRMILFAIAGIIVLVPIAFSYIYYKKHVISQNN
jgi:uncharacterized membrane protein